MIDPDKIELKNYVDWGFTATYPTELGKVCTNLRPNGELYVESRIMNRLYKSGSLDEVYGELREYIITHPKEIQERILLHQLA